MLGCFIALFDLALLPAKTTAKRTSDISAWGDNLKEFLDANQVRYTVLTHSAAHTGQEVAAAQHVPGKEFAKVVMVKAGERFVMAVLEAPQRLDLEKLTKLLPEKTARIAT